MAAGITQCSLTNTNRSEKWMGEQNSPLRELITYFFLSYGYEAQISAHSHR